MRHQNKGFKLGRTQPHRKATLSALANALIRHKRIKTTLTKARALRMYVEPIINRAKEDTTHSRRQAFRYLRDKHAVKELFGDIAEQIGDRPGGYTRVVKLGQRAGDSAQMAIIELVDYNDEKPEGSSRDSGRRRTRRGGSGSSRRQKKSTTAAAAPTVDEAEEVAVNEEGAVAEADEATEEEVAVAEEVVEEEVAEEVEEAADVVEAVEEDAVEAGEEEAAESAVAEAEEPTEGDEPADEDAGEEEDKKS